MLSIRIGANFNLFRMSHIRIIHLSFEIIFDIKIDTLSSRLVCFLYTDSFFIDGRVRI